MDNIAQVPMKHERNSGYSFLDKIKGKNGFHPGEDLNSGRHAFSDMNMEVKPASSGRVVFASFAGQGWGNLVVIYHPELSELFGHPVWSRMAHFKSIMNIE